MDFTLAEIEKKAAECARDLLERARENEPLITADLQKIAREAAVEMVGLEYKSKSAESLARKIVWKTSYNFRIFTEADFSLLILRKRQ